MSNSSMTSSDHFAQAIYHLKETANANHDHLLIQAEKVLWNQRVLQSAAASAALTLLATQSEVSTENRESWLLDSRLSSSERRLRVLDD
jgi:hypothetical protein